MGSKGKEIPALSAALNKASRDGTLRYTKEQFVTAVENALSKNRKTQTKGSGVLIDVASIGPKTIEFVGKIVTSKEGLKETEKKSDYDVVADELAAQSKLSRKEVDNILSGIDKSKLDQAIDVLKDFFATGE